MSKQKPVTDSVDAWLQWQSKFEQANTSFEGMLDSQRKRRKAIEAENQSRSLELQTQLEAELARWTGEFTQAFQENQANLLLVAPIHDTEVSRIPMLRAAYSDRTAALMSKLARLAYYDFQDAEKKKILNSILTRGKFTKLETLAFGETEALVAETDKFCVVAFRGTAGRDDVRTDLQVRLNAEKFTLVDLKRKVEVKVHSGFLAAYQKVQLALEEILATTGQKPIYLTGHSLGGALALIASASLGDSSKSFADRLAAVYTFCAPRVGGRDFSKFVKAPHYRIVNGGDLVPLVPPSWLLGYVHTGTPVLLKKTADAPLFHSQRGSAALYALLGLFLWPFTRRLLFLQRHSTLFYEQNLHRIAIIRSGGAFDYLAQPASGK